MNSPTFLQTVLSLVPCIYSSMKPLPRQITATINHLTDIICDKRSKAYKEKVL